MKIVQIFCTPSFVITDVLVLYFPVIDKLTQQQQLISYFHNEWGKSPRKKYFYEATIVSPTHLTVLSKDPLVQM